ncbi:MAG: TIGR03862 family flavoprotein [Beijerinckiaceae bacterium]|nr:TIGR03862 family flavoprotein [Beijerinckiaceae bacterium]
MAAERMAAAGLRVTVFDRMPSPARKFLMAGRGGLNLTHGENFGIFVGRYAEAATALAPMLDQFPPEALRAWSAELGEDTFKGSSGRVFPRSFKASPLLRAWLRRLDAAGVEFKMRHAFKGFSPEGAAVIHDADGKVVETEARACVLALGGASWPRLGSDGGWVNALQAQGVDVRPLRPSNCGFEARWSDIFASRFAGTPLKPVTLSLGDEHVRGEAMVTAHGLEGGAVYAMSARLRETIAAQGSCVLNIDLRPDVSTEVLAERLARPRAGQSTSTFLRKAAGLQPVGVALLRETEPEKTRPTLSLATADPRALAERIKQVPVRLHATRPIDRAISSAGGVAWSECDAGLMLTRLPGVFVCGEMLDWEAPTGGYLLQACFATGYVAGGAAAEWAMRERVVTD